MKPWFWRSLLSIWERTRASERTCVCRSSFPGGIPWCLASGTRWLSIRGWGQMLYSAKDKVLSCKTVPNLEERDGNVLLKRNHDYFFQIQEQMLCVGAEMAYFIVYTLLKTCWPWKLPETMHSSKQRSADSIQAFLDNHFKHALLEVHLFRTFADADKSCRESDDNW